MRCTEILEYRNFIKLFIGQWKEYKSLRHDPGIKFKVYSSGVLPFSF